MKKLIHLTILVLVSLHTIAQETERSICTDSTREDIEKSLIYFLDRLAKDSSDLQVYYNIGMCYYKLKRFPEAIRYFDILINKNPGYPLAYSNRGLIKLFMNQNLEACSDFKQSIRHGYNPKAINGMTLRKWCKDNCDQKRKMKNRNLFGFKRVDWKAERSNQ